jgi:hypothetical protein
MPARPGFGRYPDIGWADFKFAGPKRARPRPSGIGGFRAKAVPVTHPPVTCGINSDFLVWFLRILIIVPKSCRREFACANRNS